MIGQIVEKIIYLGADMPPEAVRRGVQVVVREPGRQAGDEHVLVQALAVGRDGGRRPR